MANPFLAQVAALRKEVAELREDSSVSGEAQAQMLHKLDVILALLHERLPPPKVRRRGVHRSSET